MRLTRDASVLGPIGLATGAGMAPRPRKKGVGLEKDALRDDNIRRVPAHDQSEVRFALHGEFDAFNKLQLSGALTPCVAARTLTVDLAHATFIDASTLGVLAHVAGRRRELRATRLRIINVNTHLRKIFSICQLDNVFEFDGGAARTQPRAFIVGALAVATHV